MRTSKNFTLSERFFFRTERPLTNSPPLILASSSPQVCFWVVLIPKNWGGGFGNLKSCWYSAACVLSRQEFAYVNDSAISSGPQVRTPSTEGAQEQYSDWNTRHPPTLHILKQNQECQAKPHVFTKVTPGIFLCLLRFETYFKFTLSATWISPSLLELPNSVFAAKATIRYTHKTFITTWPSSSHTS